MTEQKKASLEGLFHPLRSDGKPYDSEDPLPDPMETIKVGLNRQQEDFVRESKYWIQKAGAAAELVANSRKQYARYDFEGRLKAKEKTREQKAKYTEARGHAVENLHLITDQRFVDEVRAHFTELDREFTED
jgi:hypothetical protein